MPSDGTPRKTSTLKCATPMPPAKCRSDRSARSRGALCSSTACACQSAKGSPMSDIIINMLKPHTVAEQFRDLKYPNLVNFQDEWLSYDGAAYQPIEDAACAPPSANFCASVLLCNSTRSRRTTARPSASRSRCRSPRRTKTSTKCTRIWNICATSSEYDGPAVVGLMAASRRSRTSSICNGLLDVVTRDFIDGTPMFFTRTALPI